MKLDLEIAHIALDLVLFASVDLSARYLWVGVNAAPTLRVLYISFCISFERAGAPNSVQRTIDNQALNR
jgi:hypothetical protein